MEFHEVYSFLSREQTKVTPTTATTLTTSDDGDQSSVSYSSDESFDSFYDSPSQLHNKLISQPQRYHHLPASSLSSLLIPGQSLLTRRESNTSLSRLFAQGVRRLKQKVLSPSIISSASEGSCGSSIEYPTTLSHDAHPYDNVYEATERDAIVHQLAPPLLSPIPNPVNKRVQFPTLQGQKPQQQQLNQISQVTSPSPTHQLSMHPRHQRQLSHHHQQHHAYQNVIVNDSSASKVKAAAVTAIHHLATRKIAPPLLPPVFSTSALSPKPKRRSRVRHRLGSIWHRRLFRPSSSPRIPRKVIPKFSTNNIDTIDNVANKLTHFHSCVPTHVFPTDDITASFDRSAGMSSLEMASQAPDLSAFIKSPSTLLSQLSANIQELQCMMDIEIQSVEDHQRDILFYSNQLKQLDHDMNHLNDKVWNSVVKVEREMDPIQEEIQRTIPLLEDLRKKHHIIVDRFAKNVLQIKTKDSFNKLQIKVKSALQHIERWDMFTYWTFLISVTLSSCSFFVWLVYSTGFIFTLISISILIYLFYDASS